MPIYLISNVNRENSLMELKNYNTYSVISSSADKNNMSANDVIEKFNNLKNFRTIKEAKQFLLETFNVSKNNGITYISGCYPIQLMEDDKVFLVQLDLQQQNIAFCYRKGENVK